MSKFLWREANAYSHTIGEEFSLMGLNPVDCLPCTSTLLVFKLFYAEISIIQNVSLLIQIFQSNQKVTMIFNIYLDTYQAFK